MTETTQPAVELSPEEKALMQRVMSARGLGYDFAQIMGRTGVAPDLAVIAGFTVLQAALANLTKINKDAAEQAAQVIARDYEILCNALELSFDTSVEKAN